MKTFSDFQKSLQKRALKLAGKQNMSRVRKQRNGNYTDANGKVIFSNGKMDPKAKLYLTAKYGSDYAKRAEANMGTGNIYDSKNRRADGKIVGWRIDNGRGRDSSWNKEIANKAMKGKVADNRVRKDSSGRYMFKDKKTGLWTYFNQDAKDAAVARNNTKVNANAQRRNQQGSLGRVINNYTEGIANAGKSALEGVAHTVINPFRLGWDAITGNYDSSRAARYLTEPMGDFARAGLSFMGAQAAPLGETLNQLGVADTVGKYGKVFDTNQWLGTIAGGGTPWADENKGLETAANRWGWNDETKKAVGNITDSANLAAMLLGTKGATGTARAIGTGTRALGRGVGSFGSKVASASRNATQRVGGWFNRGKGAQANIEAVTPAPQTLGKPQTIYFNQSITPKIVQPTPLTPAEARTWANTMRSSGTGEHAAVQTMPTTYIKASVEPKTRLVWRDVDANGDIIVRSATRTPKAVMEATKAAKRVKAAQTANSGVTIVRDATGRPLKADPVRPKQPVVESDPAALQQEIQQFAREVDPYYMEEVPQYVDPAAFEEPFLPFSDSGEFFIPGFFKKGGKMLQKFKKGKKMKSSYVKNQPITRTWVNDGKDFVNQYNLNPRGRISGTSNWNQGRIAALADPNSTILMEELGLNQNSTTQDIQKAMQDYASRTNLRFSNINDSNFVDNKWGNQTQSAWNQLLTYVNNLGNQSNYQATNPIPQRTYIPSITRSAWDYSRGIDNLGFNNYAGLVNFVKGNANHGFARDLVNRFGAVDTWKQADVENALGVSGRYGRGFLGSGDFTDMISSMAKWAGENDAKYDNRFNAPKKKISTFNAGDLVRKANAIKLDKTMPKLSFAKQGAKLPSRNVVERFKESRSFRQGEG